MMTTQDGKYTILTRRIVDDARKLEESLAELERQSTMEDDECYFCAKPGRYRRDLPLPMRHCGDDGCDGNIPDEAKAALMR